MPWLDIPIWHGTLDDAGALQLALAHNCACRLGTRCGAHAAMLEQRFVDGILFGRFIREQLLKEEGIPCNSELWARMRSRSGG